MIKLKEIRVCNWCQNEIQGDFIKINDIPNEGCSVLYLTNGKSNTLKSFELVDSDYCNLECFLNHVKNIINKEK